MVLGSVARIEHRQPAIMPTMKYVVVFEQTPNNWAAYVPTCPGALLLARRVRMSTG
jgi:hypothetical protein